MLNNLLYNFVIILLCLILLYFEFYKIKYFFKKKLYFKTIDLSKKSYLIYINQSITNNYSKKIILNLQKFSNKIKLKENIITIIINTKGGEFDAGIDIINEIIKYKKQNIIFECIALYAASTAFDIFQYCNKRYVLINSYLMQHNAYVQIKSDFDDFLNFYEYKFKKYKKINDKIDKKISQKIGIDYLMYKQKIKYGWEIKNGNNIVKLNLADKIIKIKY